MWADLDGDKDQENLIRGKSQRRSSSELDKTGNERQAAKIEDKVALGPYMHLFTMLINSELRDCSKN